MIINGLKALVEQGALRAVDLAFGQFVYQRARQHQDMVAQFAALLSYRLGQQDSCLDLHQLTRLELPFAPPTYSAELRAQLCSSGVVHDVDSQGASRVDKPLVISAHKLYLHRYWSYEQALMTQIARLAVTPLSLQAEEVRAWCDRLFGQPPTETDWQRTAVCVAARQRLALITGGPGTGKTTTVTRLLAMRQGIAMARGKALNIALVAPTGKAAARLGDSITAAKQHLPKGLSAHIPDTCSTIHRLLGTVPGRQQFRFNQSHPLHLDMLVVDEVSMVDLPLMSKLFAALPEHAQIIMLGDKDQLSSVEAGSVLSDLTAAALGDAMQSAFSAEMLCWLEATGNHLDATGDRNDAQQTRPLADNLVVLQKSHRFSAQSDVGQLARAFNHGDAELALNLLAANERPAINLLNQDGFEPLLDAVLPGLIKMVTALKAGQLENAFDALMGQQVLCAQRVGEWGVESLNTLIEQALAKVGMIDSSAEFYPGRPIMLSQNDHNQGLYNGDIGLVMADPRQADLLKVWFADPQGGFRGIIPNRLPAHETLFAMTIHKSQGSEFANVHLCLPLSRQGQAPRGLSRELVYTGLTRAREHFTLYADEHALRQSINQRCMRSSGLTDSLLDHPEVV